MSASTRSSYFVDHYAVLGIGTATAQEEIKRVFRQLAKKHHPDRCGGDGLQFLEIYTAYRILCDPTTRVVYDRQYQMRLRREGEAACIDIPLSRVIYPGNVAVLARRGLLRKKFRSRDRRKVLNIDYDFELPLSRREMSSRVQISIPMIVRSLCPDCAGSNTNCPACSGKGWYKAGKTLHLRVDGGLADGQILEIDVSSLRPGPFSHFKKKKIRLKISLKNGKQM